MEIKMKKILLMVLGTTSFINNVVAHNQVGIHFDNQTAESMYLILEYNDHSSSCIGGFSNVRRVKPGWSYKFMISHKPNDPKICHFRLWGTTSKNASESMIALEEHFTIEQKHNAISRGNTSDHVHSHDSPPSKCGLGMTCLTHLKNDTKSLYIKVSDKDNQYAHVIFHNTTPEVTYVKFDYLKGPCSNYVADSPWIRVIPGGDAVGYIRNTHKGKICTYKARVQDNKGHVLCNTELEIGNTDKNNSIIHSAFSDCRVVVSENKWLANIMLNKINN
jgi:hypothetical protein